jgi:hypothetical protein
MAESILEEYYQLLSLYQQLILAVVNVADCADVDVGLVPFELLACHLN